MPPLLTSCLVFIVTETESRTCHMLGKYYVYTFVVLRLAEFEARPSGTFSPQHLGVEAGRTV